MEIKLSKMVIPIFSSLFLLQPTFSTYSECSDADLEVDDNVVQPPKPTESRLEGCNLVYYAIHPVISNSRNSIT